MKPVVSASQIAVQAYAQSTGVRPHAGVQSPFAVDGKAIPAKGVGPLRRVSQETDAFKIEISAEALEAANREGRHGPDAGRQKPARAVEDVAEITFQPLEGVSAGSGRREAPFAHAPTAGGESAPPKRPGSLLDISV